MLPVQRGVCVQRRNVNTKAATGSRGRAAAKVPGPLTPNRCSLCKWCSPAGECRGPAIKSGRCGDWVWYVRGSKQCRQRWAKPKDPKTPAHLRCRARLAAGPVGHTHRATELGAAAMRGQDGSARTADPNPETVKRCRLASGTQVPSQMVGAKGAALFAIRTSNDRSADDMGTRKRTPGWSLPPAHTQRFLNLPQ